MPTSDELPARITRPRRIELPGCANLRDVGGYATRSGLATAWGRLYRSAGLSHLEPGVAAQLVQVAGIRRLIDLRTSGEVGEYETAALPPPCVCRHQPLFEMIQPDWADPVDLSPRATAGRYMEMLECGAETLVRLVRSLADDPLPPTLVHCAAGRDRTGIVIACLLDLLGVPDETIAADYALSDGVIADGGRAEPETVHALLALIRGKYGSTRDLLAARGGSAGEIDRMLRGLLVDPRSRRAASITRALRPSP